MSKTIKEIQNRFRKCNNQYTPNIILSNNKGETAILRIDNVGKTEGAKYGKTKEINNKRAATTLMMYTNFPKN